MRIERRYTKENQSAYADITFRLTTSEIRNPDGSVVFRADDVEVPSFWSQVAADVLAQKYFRKAGVPTRLKRVEEETVPSWLWRSTADEEALAALPEKERTTGEHSSKQVFERLAGTWTYWGWKGGYFDSEADARAFFDELVYMLAMQMAAQNSPQWFNTGLHWAYGIDGPSQGHFYVDFATGKLVKSKSAYEHPQPHACFIQSIADDLVKRVIQFAKQGYTDIEFPVYDTDWDSDAYLTVSGQNSNNSVRVTDEFLKAVEADGDWDLFWRTKPGKIADTIKARALWEKIGYAAWACADPGLQYHTTVNDWHTCPASGPIHASNPCSEYMFLDDTACNLASMNLLAFRDAATQQFDLQGYEHAVRLWTVVLEISVLMAQFPSREIAQLSFDFRTLGLGYANLGGLLMSSGLSYDSDAGRQIAGALTAILTGVSYATSAEMAGLLGAFPGYRKNREHMLRVIRNHRRAAHGERTGYEKVATPPVPLDHKACPDLKMVEHAERAWDRALTLGEQHGFRNAQVSVIAPTGTIGLVMDCDTTGIEPDFALVKFKKLAGGGYFKIINRAVPEALRVLGYTPSQIAEIEAYAVGHGSLGQAPGINHTTLKQKGFTEEAIEKVEKALPTAFDIKFAFNKWTLGEEFIAKLGIAPEKLNDP